MFLFQAIFATGVHKGANLPENGAKLQAFLGNVAFKKNSKFRLEELGLVKMTLLVTGGVFLNSLLGAGHQALYPEDTY